MTEDSQPTFRVKTPRGTEVFGVIEALLGSNRFRVRCSDNKIRICRLPGRMRKRKWIKERDIVIIKPWEIQSERSGDVVWHYSVTEASWLRRKGVFTMQL